MDKELIKKNCYSKFNDINKRKFEQYLNFLEKFADYGDDVIERHHILPKCIFEEYKNDEWNIIKIPARVHYLAHWQLAKIFGGKNWFSFNQMRRVCRENGTEKRKSVLYSYARKYISEEIRKSNTGRVKPKELRERISKNFRNRVVVRDKNGNTFQTSVFDERYLSGELVYYRVGSKHKASTIEKMKKNNFYVKGKSYITKSGDTVVLLPEEAAKRNDIVGEGLGQKSRDKLSATFRGKTFAHDPLTKECKRFKLEEIPEGWVRGRPNFKGFSHINSSVWVLDLRTKEFRSVAKEYELNESELFLKPYPKNLVLIRKTSNNELIVGNANYKSFKEMVDVIEIKNLEEFTYNGEKILHARSSDK